MQKKISKNFKKGFTHTPTLASLLLFFKKIVKKTNFSRSGIYDESVTLQQKTRPKLVSGFTLVEIMVAVGIFSIVMLMAISAVLSIVAANKKAQSLSSVINNLNFVFESMVRDLRTGTDYSCSGSCEQISFKSSLAKPGSTDVNVTYEFNQSAGSIRKIINDGGSFESYDLTAKEVHIEELNFYVSGEGKPVNGDYEQANILITLKGYAGSASEDSGGDVTVKEDSKFNLQTMITQRKLDIDDARE